MLYLRGLSTGDFREALAALLGDDGAGLSATNIARLTNEWEVAYRALQKRSLADRDYVYVWVDGVHFNVRLDDDRLCTLVMIGACPDGKGVDRRRGRLPRVIRFVSEYGAKYPKAVATLERDADALLTFFDFPAQLARLLPAEPLRRSAWERTARLGESRRLHGRVIRR